MVELTGENFKEEVLQSRIPVLVDFYADWCGPCQMAKPVLEELEKEYQGKVKFSKVNIDASPVIAGKYGVMSVPTVVFFKEGKEASRQVGFSGKQGYTDLIEKNFNS